MDESRTVSIRLDKIIGKFEIPCSNNDLMRDISNYFNINLNMVDHFFVQFENSVLPLNLLNLKPFHEYNLMIKYKNTFDSNSFNQNNIQSANCHNATQDGGQSQDAEYFGGYSHLTIHKTMLQDSSRTSVYKKGIEESVDSIFGKTVLDVGTGTGVLSIFAARTGAKCVYAVDASSIVNDAELVISANNLSNTIKVFEGKIEEIVLPVKQVDVIISEWMGSLLLYESMLVSVINARDRFLAPWGIMLPSFCSMHISPIEVSEYIKEHIDFWGDVYGVDMKVLHNKASSEFLGFPIFNRTVKPSELLAKGEPFFSFSTNTITENDIETIMSTFRFVITRPGFLHGFCCWFDVKFLDSVLSTSPEAPETHWKQVMLLFNDYPMVASGTVINGIILMNRGVTWRRHYEINIKYWLDDSKQYYQKKFPVC